MWIENRSKGRSIAGSIPIVVVVKVKEHKIAILEPRELFPFQCIHTQKFCQKFYTTGFYTSNTGTSQLFLYDMIVKTHQYQ